MAKLTSRARRWSGRGALALVLALVLMLAGGPAVNAGNILRRSGAAGHSADPAAAASAAATAAAAQAAVAAQQTQNPLRRSLDAIKAQLALQDAARAAAQATPGQVPDGLQAGGLQVADGVTHPQQLNGCDPSMLWCGAGLPQAQTSQDGRTQVTITQDAQKAILSWKTFNVGSQTDLTFDQTAGKDKVSDWVALNRVVDPNARPSQILGSIKADGQVYVINPNGILFGGTSQVNVSTLIASTLDWLRPRCASMGVRIRPWALPEQNGDQS